MPVYENIQIIDGEEVAIAIEVDRLPEPEGPYRDLRDGNRTLAAVRDLFGEAMALAQNSATRVTASMRQMNEAIKPDQFELQFAVKLDTEAGAIIAKTSAGAQLQIKMTWKRKEEE
jgi:hypothetical protein